MALPAFRFRRNGRACLRAPRYEAPGTGAWQVGEDGEGGGGRIISTNGRDHTVVPGGDPSCRKTSTVVG